MAKVFTRFGAMNKIIRKLIFIRAFVRRAVIKVSFKGNKSANLSHKLIKEFQNLLHILVLLVLALVKLFKGFLEFLLSIYALNC